MNQSDTSQSDKPPTIKMKAPLGRPRKKVAEPKGPKELTSTPPTTRRKRSGSTHSPNREKEHEKEHEDNKTRKPNTEVVTPYNTRKRPKRNPKLFDSSNSLNDSEPALILESPKDILKTKAPSNGTSSETTTKVGLEPNYSDISSDTDSDAKTGTKNSKNKDYLVDGATQAPQAKPQSRTIKLKSSVIQKKIDELKQKQAEIGSLENAENQSLQLRVHEDIVDSGETETKEISNDSESHRDTALNDLLTPKKQRGRKPRPKHTPAPAPIANLQLQHVDEDTAHHTSVSKPTPKSTSKPRPKAKPGPKPISTPKPKTQTSLHPGSNLRPTKRTSSKLNLKDVHDDLFETNGSVEESADSDEPLLLISFVKSNNALNTDTGPKMSQDLETPSKPNSRSRPKQESMTKPKSQTQSKPKLNPNDSGLQEGVHPDITQSSIPTTSKKRKKAKKPNPEIYPNEAQDSDQLTKPQNINSAPGSASLSDLEPGSIKESASIALKATNSDKNIHEALVNGHSKQTQDDLPPSITSGAAKNSGQKGDEFGLGLGLELDPILDSSPDANFDIDEEGEKKIDKDGNLIGDRSFVIPIFTLPSKNNSSTMYMLLTHIMKFAGFRDTNHMQRLYPKIKRIEANAEQRNYLIDQGWIYITRKRLPAFLITAYNAFREFGSKIIINGKYGIDDYYESKSKNDCLHEYGAVVGPKSLGLRKFTSAASLAEDENVSSPPPARQRAPPAPRTRDRHEKPQLELVDISTRPHIASLVEWPPSTNLSSLVPAPSSPLQEFTASLFDDFFSQRRPASDNMVLGEANHITLLNALRHIPLSANKYSDILKPNLPSEPTSSDSKQSSQTQKELLDKHICDAKISSNQTILANRSLLFLRTATNGVFFDPHTKTIQLPSHLQPNRVTVRKDISGTLSSDEPPTAAFEFSFKAGKKNTETRTKKLNDGLPMSVDYSDLNCCDSIKRPDASFAQNPSTTHKTQQDIVSILNHSLDSSSAIDSVIPTYHALNTRFAKKARFNLPRKNQIASKFPLALTIDQRQDLLPCYQTRFGKTAEQSKLGTKNLLVKSFWESIFTSTSSAKDNSNAVINAATTSTAVPTSLPLPSSTNYPPGKNANLISRPQTQALPIPKAMPQNQRQHQHQPQFQQQLQQANQNTFPQSYQQNQQYQQHHSSYSPSSAQNTGSRTMVRGPVPAPVTLSAPNQSQSQSQSQSQNPNPVLNHTSTPNLNSAPVLAQLQPSQGSNFGSYTNKNTVNNPSGLGLVSGGNELYQTQVGGMAYYSSNNVSGSSAYFQANNLQPAGNIALLNPAPLSKPH